MAKARKEPPGGAPAPASTDRGVGEARERLAKERAERQATCVEAVDAILKRHRCVLVPFPIPRYDASGTVIVGTGADLRLEAMP